MSRSAADPASPPPGSPLGGASPPRSVSRLLVVLVAASLSAPLPPAGAQPVATPPPAAAPSAEIQLTGPVQQSLLQLQEQWLNWITAFHQHRERTAEALVANLLTTVRRIGMSRLPDLALAALVSAVDAAGEGDFERAWWALDAAERLDPGRAETAFAAARVAAGERSFLRASGWYLRGYGRLFSQPWLRVVWTHHLLFWLWTALVATGILCLTLVMATRGRGLVHDLAAFFERWLPRAAALPLALLLLVLPAALPYGIAWIVLAWTVLLWAYLSLSERLVLAMLLLLVGVAPFLAAAQARRVSIAVSPPMRAVESLALGQLYGDLFRDLAALRTALPQSPATTQLVADLHRRLGQWELARAFYRDVLAREPQNTAALLDLGAYYFADGDFGSAIQLFQQAAAADPQSAAAQFNLSQAYSESYLFDEQRRALEQARAIDADEVNGWVESERQRVVVADGGLERIPEIRRELLATYRPPEGGRDGGWLQRGLGLALAGAVVLAAALLGRLRRSAGDAEQPPVGAGRHGHWLRAFVPGLAAAQAGEGGRSFLALLLPVVLLLLPLGRRIGYPAPWGYDPGNLVPWVLAIAGLVVYLGARLSWELRHRV